MIRPGFCLCAAVACGLAGLPALGQPGSTPLELVRKIKLHGRPGKKLDHMALDAKRDRLFVANMANRTLDVIDLKAGKLLKEVPGQKGIQGCTYAPDLDRVFVGLGVGGFCNAFDGATYKLLKSVPFPRDADNVRYDPRHKVVYVAHVEDRLGILDAKTFKVLADLNLPSFPESLTLERDRPLMYLNTPATNKILVFDTARRKVVRTYALTRAGANYPLAVDEASRRLFVGCRKPPAVVVLDSESGKEVAAVPIRGDIDDLFYDARRKRLYASCGEGALVVLRQIDADRYEALARLPTAKLARTCLFDAERGRLFLAVPRQPGWEGPEIWVYRARP